MLQQWVSIKRCCQAWLIIKEPKLTCSSFILDYSSRKSSASFMMILECASSTFLVVLDFSGHSVFNLRSMIVNNLACINSRLDFVAEDSTILNKNPFNRKADSMLSSSIVTLSHHMILLIHFAIGIESIWSVCKKHYRAEVERFLCLNREFDNFGLVQNICGRITDDQARKQAKRAIPAVEAL